MTRKMVAKIDAALLEHGATVVRRVFDTRGLARLRAFHDWCAEHPSPDAYSFAGHPNLGDVAQGDMFADVENPAALPKLEELLATLSCGELLADLWNSQHVWCHGDETLRKEREAPRTAWHQDSAYLPSVGEHWACFWIPFESLPRQYVLETVRGTHRGPQYDGYQAHDPTLPLWGDANAPPWPPAPDIHLDLERDSGAWQVLSWDLEPGDAIVFHPAALHGGAPTDGEVSIRHSTTLRFFGDAAYVRLLPGQEDWAQQMGVRNGDPYRPAGHLQVR